MAAADVAQPRPVSPGQYEFLQNSRRDGDAPLNVYADVRAQDGPQSTLSKSGAQLIGDGNTPLVKWQLERGNRMRPIDFQPTGSFKVLKEAGKLVQKDGQFAAEYKGREKREVNQASHLPGYTGFVRGAQHISGRTYGETTRRALESDYREIVSTSPVPSKPQANRKITHEKLQNSYVSKLFENEYHIPGYTGHVPGIRQTLGKTYGNATQQELNAHHTIHPRKNNERASFAKTAIPRQYLAISSAPLPGGIKTNNPPDMYIPAHLRYLKFMPM